MPLCRKQPDKPPREENSIVAIKMLEGGKERYLTLGRIGITKILDYWNG